MKVDLDGWLADCQHATNDFLSSRLLQSKSAPKLLEAMRYSLLAGGKRLRPALVYATAKLGGLGISETLPFGAAVECMHTYSLCHDDLPAMDDDNLRRGKPACHVAYDEATAILTGDALQTLAFEILTDASHGDFPIQSRLQIVQILAYASGMNGMVSGQVLDMAAEKQTLSLEALSQLHEQKTGALLCASVEIGAVAANLDPQETSALLSYGKALGLAFQITDDCLDVTQSSAELGKPQYSDNQASKSTYVTLLGLEGARAEARKYAELALDAIASFGNRADKLGAMTAFAIDRKN